MSDFQGLMMEPEGSDDGASKLPAPLSDPESQSWSKCIPREYQQVQTRLGCVVSLWSTSVFRFHHQTLETITVKVHSKTIPTTHAHRLDMLFYYRVLVLTFQHHQTLKIVHGQSTSQDDFYKTKHGQDTLFHYGVPVFTFWLHHQTLKANYGQSPFKNSIKPK
ncbi:hypothetical protein EVAR_100298_1 [Eumeta japonica]|uniref:Uncharacterized protein n=1 Tax=Eumeta variegata TaxID=151549 RepID=A0A4C1T463_EUMVA|nr:hypothetical protein EVAR_100298_1 [Eumeta japonica]